MLFATLGKLDLITVLILLGAAVLPQKFMLYAAVYLLIKGLVFGFLMSDFASKVDFACGIYLAAFSYGLSIPIVHTLVLLWLFQKTALTFLAIGVKLTLFYYENKHAMPSFLR